MNEPILFRKKGLIAWLRFNRPERRNALSLEMAEALEYFVGKVESDQTTRVVIISGEGKSFMAGSDIKELSQRNLLSGWSTSRRRQNLFHRLDNMSKPTIAAISGHAYGAGCEIASCCTLRIASEDAFFGQLEINLGLIPGAGATQRLPRLIGKGRALELLLTGKVIGAEEAYRIGLVNRVVKPEEIDEQAEKWAEAIAEKSDLAVNCIIEAVNKGIEAPILTGYQVESALFSICLVSDYARKQLGLFLERKTK